jgi:hypothetical protein
MQIGETARSNRAREKLEESVLSSKLADQTLRKRAQDLENVRKTHEQFSMWWNGMDAQEQAIAQSSDQYKEMQKFFKSFKDLVPGLVKDNGEIVASDLKDIFKNKLSEQAAKAKMRIAEGKGTAEDIRLLYVTEEQLDKLSGALKAVAARLKNEGAEGDAKDPVTFMQKVREFFAGSKQPTRAQAEPEVTQPSAVGITQPQAPVSPLSEGLKSDPLGILGR